MNMCNCIECVGDQREPTDSEIIEYQAARIKELEAERDRLRVLVKLAFMQGFSSPSTYNDTVLNDEDSEWLKSESFAALTKEKS